MFCRIILKTKILYTYWN